MTPHHPETQHRRTYSPTIATPLRVALATIGNPDDPGLWSGTPNNIARALRALGIEVVPIDVTVPLTRVIVDTLAAPYVLRRAHADGLYPAVGRARLIASESILLARARSAKASSELRRAGALDGVIQVGTGYLINHPRVMSYEDMTIPQAVDCGEYFWDDVPQRRLRARIKLQASAYHRNSGATFSTNWAAESAVQDLGCAPGKASVVGIGPNFETSTTTGRNWAVPRFLFVGREWGRKNGDAVVRAFAEVRQRHPLAELHLAGDHPRVDTPGVEGHGYLSLRDPIGRERMKQLWAQATCCVVPSRFEPAGIIYVEALHAGIPSIGTTRGGAADIIGYAGCTVDPGDQEALTRAMLQLCDPSAAAAAGQHARERREQFTWIAVAKGLLQTLGLVVDGR